MDLEIIRLSKPHKYKCLWTEQLNLFRKQIHRLQKPLMVTKGKLWGVGISQEFGVYIFTLKESESEVAQSCLTLCDPADCRPPGSSVHGTVQARILEWVAVSFSRGSSRPRDRTQVSRIAGRRFNLWATREAQNWWRCQGHTLLYIK